MKSEAHAHLGALSSLRESQGLSQADVAKKMRTSQAQIARIEKSPMNTKVVTLSRYLNAVNGASPRVLVTMADVTKEFPLK